MMCKVRRKGRKPSRVLAANVTEKFYLLKKNGSVLSNQLVLKCQRPVFLNLTAMLKDPDGWMDITLM